jgi:hypothetical protein
MVHSHGKALAFIEQVHKSMELSEGGPFDCGLRLTVRCVPDLDGDGLAEIVVRANWEERFADYGAKDSEEEVIPRCHARNYRGPNSPYSSLFILLSKERSPWPGTVRLLEDNTGSGREGPTRVEVAKWHGRSALKLHLSFMHSDSGRIDLTSKVLIVQHGKLVAVQVRNEGTGQ